MTIPSVLTSSPLSDCHLFISEETGKRLQSLPNVLATDSIRFWLQAHLSLQSAPPHLALCLRSSHEGLWNQLQFFLLGRDSKGGFKEPCCTTFGAGWPLGVKQEG